MPNLLSKLNYMGTYICASIVGFGRKVEKKNLQQKEKTVSSLDSLSYSAH